MAKKEYQFQGKNLEQLKKLSIKEFAAMIPSRNRRKVSRGFTDAEKQFLSVLEHSQGTVKTHCRDMIVLPLMVGRTLAIHKGNSFEEVTIVPEMIGCRLGELSLTRRRVQHGNAGVGASKGRSAVSVR